MEIGFHGGSSGLGLGIRLRLVWWKQLEARDTRGSRLTHVGVYASSWKVPPNIIVEVAIDGSNGSFHFRRQSKVPCISMQASTNFHGSILPRTSMKISVEANILPPISMEFSVEISMEVDRKSEII